MNRLTLILFFLNILILAGCGEATVSPASITTSPSPTALPTITPSPTNTPTGPLSGQTRTDDKGIEQVWVPAGSFMMGSSQADIDALKAKNPPRWVSAALPSETPLHEVELSSGYWIDKYEVTNAAFQAFVDDGGYQTRTFWSDEGWSWLSRQNVDNLPQDCTEKTQSDHPRVCVTWFEAQAYAHWRGGNLPTEAEWEYAARGPESSIYPWGDTFDSSKANVIDSSGLTPVGSYPNGVSWVGAHDMAGNAMEWVQDWLDRKYYEKSEQVDPRGPEIGSRKVEKGGWWGSNPFVARSAYRHFEDTPDYQDDHIGFRVVSR